MKFEFRRVVQFGFLTLVLLLGIQFYRFVIQFESAGIVTGITRPSGIEAFLPIGGFTALKHWWSSGRIDPAHPASLFLFVAAVTLSALAAKSFCGWICPVGFLSELAYLPWKKRFGKNIQLPRWLDYPLRSLKYLLLGFFVWIIGFSMSSEQATLFLQSDYWKVADVKMLYFFTRITTTSLIVIGILVLLSIPTRGFWCRFLCPYGALLGLVGQLSPFRIRRNPDLCVSCHKCTRNCPAHLPVSRSLVIRSPECSSCLTCQSGCRRGALTYAAPSSFTFLKLNSKKLAIGVVGLYFAWILAAKITGHWESQISPSELQTLVPQAAESLPHPR